jgi:hypothetical protein
MNAIKRLTKDFYSWLTQKPYSEGWDDGVIVGHQLAQKDAKLVVTVSERKRFKNILKRERERLIQMEKLHWDGYNADIVAEIDVLMVLVDDERGNSAK